jgi:hypothetical protein
MNPLSSSDINVGGGEDPTQLGSLEVGIFDHWIHLPTPCAF